MRECDVKAPALQSKPSPAAQRTPRRARTPATLNPGQQIIVIISKNIGDGARVCRFFCNARGQREGENKKEEMFFLEKKEGVEDGARWRSWHELQRDRGGAGQGAAVWGEGGAAKGLCSHVCVCICVCHCVCIGQAWGVCV